MPDWVVTLLGIIGSLSTLLLGVFVAWRYAKMGGGEAQQKLNVTLKELTEAYEEKLQLRDATIAEMKTDFAACKGRMEAMESREEAWLAEKIELKRELAEVYRRLGMTKRDSDPPNEATP